MLELDVVELVKFKASKKLAENPDITDEDLLIIVQEIEQKVRNYCMIPKIPDALVYTIANMSVDLLLYTIEKNSEGTDDVDLSLMTSLNIGDTLIKFSGSENKTDRQTTLQAHKSNLDNLIYNYKEDLNKFRRIL